MPKYQNCKKQLKSHKSDIFVTTMKHKVHLHYFVCKTTSTRTSLSAAVNIGHSSCQRFTMTHSETFYGEENIDRNAHTQKRASHFLLSLIPHNNSMQKLLQFHAFSSSLGAWKLSWIGGLTMENFRQIKRSTNYDLEFLAKPTHRRAYTD